MVAVFGLLSGPMTQADDAAEITVYKTPTCGCCGKWVDHLRENGFSVVTKTVDNVAPVKSANNLPPGLASCHTGIVDGYVIEGHVPAEVIKRLLEEKPDILGIAVPGMPPGSPGMEVGYTEPYEILSFDAEGKTKVYDTR